MSKSDPYDPELSPEIAYARLNTAWRRGRPEWPWPEIAVGECRAAMEILARAASQILISGTAEMSIEGDARIVGLAGYVSGMGPLMGYWMEQGVLAASARIARELALHLDHNRRRNAKLIGETRNMVGLLAEQGIEAFVLKGMHTAQTYFPEPGTRPVSDIDLLVRRTDAVAANAFLARRGFHAIVRNSKETTWRPPSGVEVPRTLRFVHTDDPWAIDLHHSIGSTTHGTRLDAAAARFFATRLATAAGPHGLTQPFLLLHLAAHASENLQSLTLVRIVELVLVIRRDVTSSKLDWNEFLAEAARARALGLVYPALHFAALLSPNTIPEFILMACANAAPTGVHRALRRLSPASAQRLDRCSVSERYMWARGWTGVGRELWRSLLPPNCSAREVARIYNLRIRRLLAGRIGP